MTPPTAAACSTRRPSWIRAGSSGSTPTSGSAPTTPARCASSSSATLCPAAPTACSCIAVGPTRRPPRASPGSIASFPSSQECVCPSGSFTSTRSRSRFRARCGCAPRSAFAISTLPSGLRLALPSTRRRIPSAPSSAAPAACWTCRRPRRCRGAHVTLLKVSCCFLGRGRGVAGRPSRKAQSSLEGSPAPPPTRPEVRTWMTWRSGRCWCACCPRVMRRRICRGG